VHRTTIPFRLERPGRVALRVYDVLGRRVATLADEAYPAGPHKITWSPESLPSGVYAVRLTGPSFSLTRRVVLVR